MIRLMVAGLLLWLWLAPTVFADTIQNTDKGTGELWLQTDSGRIPAPLLDTAIQLSISGLIARAVVRQTFHNPSAQWVEGSYAFPLPNSAAVDHLRMHIGERIIEGEIQEKQQALKTYQQAKQAGKKTSLVQQHRPNLFSTRVANIGPQENVIIEIEYQQEVNYRAGEFSLRVPLAVGPRYVPPVTQHIAATSDGFSSSVTDIPALPDINFDPFAELPLSLSVDLDAGLPLQQLASGSHAMNIQQLGDGRYHLQLQNTHEILDRDFELHWQPKAADAPLAAIFTEQTDQQHYAQIMIMPPQAKQTLTLPRAVTFIIDISGSMQGDSIVQARAAVEQALTQLTPQDRFNVIAFNNDARSLWSQLHAASRTNRIIAREFVRGLQANGGTEMAPALSMALGEQSDATHVRQIVFLTDGSVGNEQPLLNLINQRIGKARLFTIGIGSAPNGYFMETAAREGRGTYTYIASQQDVAERMNSLFKQLQHPVLTDIQVNWPASTQVASYPEPVPDLYQGEPLRLLARAQQFNGNIIVAGKRGDTPWQVTLNTQGKGHEGIGVAWARAKIKDLMRQQRQANDKDVIRKQVIDTAMAHHLVSRYTSLVAVDKTPSRPQQEALHDKAVAQNLPKGWSYQKVFGQLPQTASPALLWLLIGSAGMLVSLISGRRK